MPKDIAPPARGFSFKDFSLSKPGQALPGDRLDTELDRLVGKFSDLEAFLLTSFERDGSLKGGAVDQRHLKPDVLGPAMRRIDDLIQKTRQELDQREKSTQNLATEARNARAQAETAAEEARGAAQEARSLNQRTHQAAQAANQTRARTEAALVPLANLQSDAQTAANSARIAEDMAYRWAEKTDGPVFVPNGGDPVDDGFYSSKFWAMFTRSSIENGSFWYLGALDAPPTVGNDGQALLPGMWYFDTGNGQTFIWNGTAWDPITGAAGTVLSVFGRQGAIQAQANDYQAFYLKLSGGTLTGALTLSANPTALLHAANMGYVDQQDAALDASLRAYVDQQDADLDAALRAYTNQQDAALDASLRAYADSRVATRLPLAGGQMSGQIKAVGSPVAPEDLGSKGYIDSQVATRLTQAQADARFLQLAGGTLTNFLTLHANPAQALHAATKNYVDSAVPAYATQVEAREGTRADRIMSPALVAALSGQETQAWAGLQSINFAAIPPEATEFTLQYNANFNAGALIEFTLPDDAATHGSTNQVFGAAYAAGTVTTSAFVPVWTMAAVGTLSGVFRAERNNAGSLWFMTGEHRVGATLIRTSTNLAPTGSALGRIRLRAAPGTANSGSAILRWRI